MPSTDTVHPTRACQVRRHVPHNLERMHHPTGACDCRHWQLRVDAVLLPGVVQALTCVMVACGDVPIQAGDMFLPVVITCGPSYPDKAPIVSFGDGFPDELKARLGKGRGNQIDPAKVAYLRAWNKKSTMRDLLVSMSSGL